MVKVPNADLAHPYYDLDFLGHGLHTFSMSGEIKL